MMIKQHIVLTGFMGVGKTTISKHLAYILGTERIDLDRFIEFNERRTIADIIETDGEEKFREIEFEILRKVFSDTDSQVISLGGGTWMFERNRNLIKSYNCTTVWLESTFEHCWRNLSVSKIRRPLIVNRETALNLFRERQKIYCLADLHIVIKPHFTLFEIADRILEEISG